MIFGLAILATAVLLSCVAAYYSVAGLTAIFSAATIPVIIMGGSLELGKIVATVWLHNNWRRAPFLFKAYLVPAVAFLMLLTSMGIFGYLSKAHSDQSLVSGDAIAKVAIYDEKINTAKENIATNRKALKQMDEAVDQVMGRSDDEKGADKAVALRRGQAKERARLLAEIEVEQRKVAQLSEEKAPLAAEFRKVESEVGPIKYIAALVYGDNPDANVLEKAVRLVIIMIVLVFDPLALTLILAANKQFEWAIHGTGGWVHDESGFQQELDKKREVAKSLDSGGELPPKDTTVVVEPELSFLDKHPYLLKPFKHFEGLKPMVASKEEPLAVTNSNPADNVPLGETVYVNPPGWGTTPIPDTVLDVYNDERLVSKFDKIPDVKRPGDYLTPPDGEDEEDPQIKAAMKVWKEQNPTDTLKNQRSKLMRGEIDQLPWLKMVADNDLPAFNNSGFGIDFPLNANKGDSFVRVDQFPNAVYKYNGYDWIQVDKTLTDSYTYDSAYIDHLIEKITSGEYDPELLSDSEREQVADRLQQKSKA